MFLWLNEYDADIFCEALMQNLKDMVEELRVKTENAKASLLEIDTFRIALFARQKLFLKILKKTSKIFRARSLSNLDFILMNICPPKYLEKDLRQVVSSDIGTSQNKYEDESKVLSGELGKLIEVDFSAKRRE
ncbi:MAG: hypothetical protein COU51_00765 [Parcubacteria group bacterium CG10_big_fil_rev_8_21_14_0_10_36_14]|nr:MAG: hypothetical protein COU51_00765 [Parcubacteria group bacterium CG10_big_fil_rev_8_21_14_0_10_36_14]